MVSILNGNVLALKWQYIHVISNLKYTAIYTKTWPWQFTLYSANAYSEPCQISKQGDYLLGGNYFREKLHLRCLKRFWIRYCPGNHEINQATWGKDKPHGNFKASYISVLNYWKTFETTLTTKSNERNQITYLQS